MFCPKCGSENPEESKFCESCGAPIVGEQQVEETGQVDTDTSKKPRKKLSWWKFIPIVLLAMLVLAGYIGIKYVMPALGRSGVPFPMGSTIQSSLFPFL